jgi:hypothetical protein
LEDSSRCIRYWTGLWQLPGEVSILWVIVRSTLGSHNSVLTLSTMWVQVFVTLSIPSLNVIIHLLVLHHIQKVLDSDLSWHIGHSHRGNPPPQFLGGRCWNNTLKYIMTMSTSFPICCS